MIVLRQCDSRATVNSPGTFRWPALLALLCNLARRIRAGKRHRGETVGMGFINRLRQYVLFPSLRKGILCRHSPDALGYDRKRLAGRHPVAHDDSG